MSSEHVVKLPNSIQQKSLSRRVFVRGLLTEAQETKGVSPGDQIRGNPLDGVIEQLADREMFKAVTSFRGATKAATGSLTKPGPRGPTVTPSPDKTGSVTVLQDMSELTNSGFGKGGRGLMFSPPS